MNARMTEAERLRLARRIFERAMADNISLPEARRRLSAEAHAQAAQDRLQRTRAIKGCGRSAAPAAPSPIAPAAIGAMLPLNDSDEGLLWWQR